MAITVFGEGFEGCFALYVSLCRVEGCHHPVLLDPSRDADEGTSLTVQDNIVVPMEQTTSMQVMTHMSEYTFRNNKTEYETY